jgi:hypothetical protein
MKGEDRLKPSVASRSKMRAVEPVNPGMLMINIRAFFRENLAKALKALVRRRTAKLSGRGRVASLVRSHDGAFEFIAVRRLGPERRDNSRNDVENTQLSNQAAQINFCTAHIAWWIPGGRVKH